MGLGRPPDPEHIGDTFLWMKRSEKGPNTFSQTIKDLQPGRLYSFKMLVCDYNDLITPKPKKVEEAKSISTVLIEGADVDTTRSFTEVYASSPEPKVPVCITYHWKIFRAKTTTATLTVIYCFSQFAVESNNFQQLMVDDLERRLRRNGHTNVKIKSLQHSSQKRSRIYSLETYVSQGLLRFSRKHQELLQQLTQFPLAKNDDGPDALEMAVDTARKPWIKVGAL